MQGYLTAAADISRLAVGESRRLRVRDDLHEIENLPRSGIWFTARPTGRGAACRSSTTSRPTGNTVSGCRSITRPPALYGNGRAALHTAAAPEQVEIAIDGARVAVDLDRWMNSADPDGVNLRTEPIAITAGPHTVSAAFITRFEGPVQDLITPLEWSIASTSIADAYGFTTLPHLRDMAITGPFEATGVSETPSRRKIFACQPQSPAQQTQCAHTIVTTLASQAFRRTATERDVNALMGLYRQGAAEGGFEDGVRMALEGILASPRFVFRFEERPANVREGQAYRSATSTWRRGCRSSCGRRGWTRSCSSSRRRRPLGRGRAGSVRSRACSPTRRAEALATWFVYQAGRVSRTSGRKTCRKSRTCIRSFSQQLAGRDGCWVQRDVLP